MAHAHFMLDNSVYKHTLRACNTLLFHCNNGCTKAPQCMLHLHCLSCAFVNALQYSMFLHHEIHISWDWSTSDIQNLLSIITLHCISYANKIVNFFVIVLTLRRLMSYIYMEHPFLMFLDHTQRRSTVGRTPLDE